MIETTSVTEQQTFRGVKVAKGIDPSKILEKSIFLYDEPNRTFEKYGHLVYPILTRNHKAIFDTSLGNKQWEQDGEFKKFLTQKQADSFYPFEEVSSQLTDIFETDLKDSGMKIVRQHSSHNGFSHYWECLSDRFDTKLSNPALDDDVVQVGMVVKNGIGTDVALGIDLFTMRLVCSNGAVARGKDLGTISISHATNFRQMKDRFIEAIPIAVSAAKDLIAYYQRAIYVKMNQTIAENLYKKLRLGDKYFPSYFGIDPDELKKQVEKKQKLDYSKIVNYNGNRNLWETFNDFTAGIWHSNSLQFTGKRNSEIQLHNELIKQVINH